MTNHCSWPKFGDVRSKEAQEVGVGLVGVVIGDEVGGKGESLTINEFGDGRP